MPPKYFPNTLPQVNFDHLTETASSTQFKVDMLYHCDTLPILFCHFNLDGAGKRKMVTENLEKLLSLLHTYHTYLVHLEKTEGFFQKERFMKKGGKFEISGFF